MTVYNGLPYLPAAMESVFNQTFQDFQFVVVDDGSTDGTSEYLDGLQDERLLVLHRENGGTAAAANQGLAHCTGEFCARMDADDISLPERFARQVATLEAHPELGMLGVQMAPMGPKSVGKSLHLPLKHAEIREALLTGRHALAHSALMLRTDLLKEIGGYWNYRLVDDWDMMLRMSERAECANLPELLHHYRIHRGSLNGSQMRRMRLSIDYARALAECRSSGQVPPDLEAFERLRGESAWWRRVSEHVEIFSRCHYRLAMAEILGGAAPLGYCRLALAAACQPRLTLERCGRLLRSQLRRNGHAERS
jgi:glycosyltransferase involved in cell wall biosynthesis